MGNLYPLNCPRTDGTGWTNVGRYMKWLYLCNFISAVTLKTIASYRLVGWGDDVTDNPRDFSAEIEPN